MSTPEESPPSDRSSPRSSDEEGLSQTPNPRSGSALRNSQRTTDGSHYPLLATRYSLLLSYFRSGWAFLLPYLAAYLLYAWLKWPVNPAHGGEGVVKVARDSGTVVGDQWSLVPCLLHVYWFLHGIHLMLGGFALRAWWRNSQAISNPQTAWHRLYAAIPWLGIAFLVWIPGVYLEMPTDPWAHFARVNQWSHITTPFDNPDWIKSGSFFAFSWIGHITSPGEQLKAFNIFYLACCLLYYWQYFLFARALSFSKNQALCAVLLNLVLFGNNIFGFHRYYGMSTTILSHIGLLAFCRSLIRLNQRFSPPYRAPNGPIGINFLSTHWQEYVAVLAAVSLIGMNHVQGIALAFISTAAFACWRLVNGPRRRTAIVLTVFIALNILTVWLWPGHAHLDLVYRAQGWLSPWYGFNLLSPTSPALQKTMEIFGWAGVVNLLAGIVLLRKNSLVGWLTITPVLFLLFPIVAVPFADSVARNGPPGYEYIVTFSRLFLGIPAGMALCSLFSTPLSNEHGSLHASRKQMTHKRTADLRFGYCLCALFILLALPASRPYFNRFWHILMKVPHDLEEQHIIEISRDPLFPPTLISNKEGAARSAINPLPEILSTPGVGFVIGAFGQSSVIFRNKWMLYPSLSTPIDRIQYWELSLYEHAQIGQPPIIVMPSYQTLFSPYSLAGHLSTHWLINQVALEQTGSIEMGAKISANFLLKENMRGVGIFVPRAVK